MTRTASTGIYLLMIFCLCFALRLGVGTAIDAAVPVIKRADVYSDIAVNLLRGYGFVAEPTGEPILWRAPLYPAFLAVMYRIFGEQCDTAVFVAQSALDATTATLVYWLGRRVFNEQVGVVSAVVFALYPLSAYYTLRFMPEPIFTAAFTATIAAWSFAWQHRRPGAFMAVGALSAVTALIKPVALGLWPFLAICACYRLRSQPGRAMSAVLTMTIACLIVLTPWIFRNYQVTGSLIFSATGGGYAFWLGNQAISEGREDWEVDESIRERLFERRNAIIASAHGRYAASVTRSVETHSFNEPVNFTVEEDHAFFLAAWREIGSSPFDSALLVVRKLFRFCFSIFLPENRWAQSYIVVSQVIFLSLAIVGMVAAKRQSENWHVLLLPVGFLTVATVLTFSTIRYSIPIVPVMTIFAAGGSFETVRVLTKQLTGIRPGDQISYRESGPR